LDKSVSMDGYLITDKSSENHSVISFSGDLTIRQINNILRDILLLEKPCNTLTIEISEADFIDLAFIQVLFAFAKEYLSKGNNTIDFQFSLTEELIELFDQTGIIDIFTILKHNRNGQTENYTRS